MEDMALTARLFETSSKLRLASSWLKKIEEGDDPNFEGSEALKWAGQFMCEVDWSSHQERGTGLGGRLSLQATTVRPTFYSSLFRLAPELRKAGIDSNKELLRFLNTLYANLRSGTPKKSRKKLTPEQIRLGAILLQEISRAILIQLNNNGLPRSSTWLKEEWEPSSNELTSFSEKF